MRKFYSLVLMAAALLIGTNSWAATYNVSELADLQQSISAANDGDEFVFDELYETSAVLTLNTGKHIIFTLNANYLYQGSATSAIVISNGILEIRGTKTMQSGNEELIRLYGIEEELDAKVAVAHSQVIVHEGVTLKNTVKNVLVINQLTGTNQKKLANGARIDVYGTLDGTKYGIKVNGDVKDPQYYSMARTNAPFVYIHEGALVKTLANADNAVAAYSSGYGRWRIEGTCQGSTGLYAKSGDVEIVGATIESTRPADTTHEIETGKTSGVKAGGSGIVVESNAAYPGQTSVTIAESTIIGTNGYAIEEKVANATNTKVESIEIVSGTIQGGNAGAIIVSSQTVNSTEATVAVYGGKITSENDSDPIQIDAPATGSEQQIAAQQAAVLEAVIPGYTPSMVVVGTEVPQQNTITVLQVSAGYLATLNAEGLSTFSYVDKSIKLPADLKAFKATALTNDVLTLEEIVAVAPATQVVIPANTGVILYKENAASQSFTLIATNDDASNVGTDNLLEPSSAWTTAKAGAAYILHGAELWIYDGTDFKANKAFLPIAGQGAPQRLRMVFHAAEEAQGIENVELEAAKAEKFYENGQLFIRRGNEVYNVQGQLVK
jgi:hypothetical protein